MKRNEYFKCIRENYGMSQEALAQRLMISRGAVSQHETGKNIPTMPDLELMAKIYELPLTMLSEEFAEQLPENEVALLTERPLNRENFELFLQIHGVTNSYFEIENVKKLRQDEDERRSVLMKYFESLSSSRLNELYEFSRIIDKYNQ